MTKYLLLLLLAATPIAASCGAMSCPITPDTMSLKPNQWGYKLTGDYISQTQRQSGTTQTDTLSSDDHTEVETYTRRLSLGIKYQWSTAIDIEATLPLISRKHAHLKSEVIETSGTLHDGHHDTTTVTSIENWDYYGLGDVSISAGYSTPFQWLSQDGNIRVNAGIKLPTGATHLENGDGDAAEVPLQPGDGAIAYKAGFSYSQPVGSLPMLNGLWNEIPLTIYGETTYSMAGTNGWRNGARFEGGIESQIPVTREWRGTLGLVGQYSRQSESGDTGEDVGNTGGKWVFGKVGVQTDLSRTLHWDLCGFFPVYQHLNGIQLATGWSVSTGLAVTL